MEEYEENSVSSDTSVPLFHDCKNSTVCCPEWEKRLPLHLSWCPWNSLYLPISLETTDTTKSFLVLVDFRAIGVFINQGFVEKYCLNIHKLSKLIPCWRICAQTIKSCDLGHISNRVQIFSFDSSSFKNADDDITGAGKWATHPEVIYWSAEPWSRPFGTSYLVTSIGTGSIYLMASSIRCIIWHLTYELFGNQTSQLHLFIDLNSIKLLPLAFHVVRFG